MIGVLIGGAIYIAVIGCAWAIVVVGRPDAEEQAREDVLQAAWLRELTSPRSGTASPTSRGASGRRRLLARLRRSPRPDQAVQEVPVRLEGHVARWDLGLPEAFDPDDLVGLSVLDDRGRRVGRVVHAENDLVGLSIRAVLYDPSDPEVRELLGLPPASQPE